MPARALVFALLLSCSSLAVTALSLTEEPLRDLPMTGPTALTISKVNWRMEENNTLQLCAEEDIPDGQAVLVWGVVGAEGKSESIEEKGDDGDPKCSTFQMSSFFRLPAEPTLYQLAVELEDAIGFAALGSIEFAMTAKSSILSCGDSKVTKLSWATESPITYTDECMKTRGTPFDTDCYIETSFSNKDICFDVTSPQVTVCLTGPIDDVQSNGQLSVNSLAYGAPAVLSLNYRGLDMENMRAIVRLAADPARLGQPGQATVYDCPLGLCQLIDGSAPIYETYEVCGEARDVDDGHSLQTATATIIDLNLFVFVGGTNVLEFVFANGLENGMYTASLFNTAPRGDTTINTISVDCTEVEAGHACFGFFSSPTTGTMSVALSEKSDDSNKIIATYVEQIAEQAQVYNHGPQFNHSVRTKLPS